MAEVTMALAAKATSSMNRATVWALRLVRAKFSGPDLRRRGIGTCVRPTPGLRCRGRGITRVLRAISSREAMDQSYASRLAKSPCEIRSSAHENRWAVYLSYSGNLVGLLARVDRFARGLPTFDLGIVVVCRVAIADLGSRSEE